MYYHTLDDYTLHTRLTLQPSMPLKALFIECKYVSGGDGWSDIAMVVGWLQVYSDMVFVT